MDAEVKRRAEAVLTLHCDVVGFEPGVGWAEVVWRSGMWSAGFGGCLIG